VIESVLRGAIQVHPRPEGGRNLVVFCSESDAFRIPMDAEQAADIGRVLALSDEDFEAETERQAAASRLVVPATNGNGNHPS